MLNELNIKLIKAIETHMATGYYMLNQHKDCNEVIEAIKVGKIRLTLVRDDDYDIDDLCGDCFDPIVNCDVSKNVLSRQRNSFLRRVREQGVHCAVSEYWTGRDWESFEGVEHNVIGGFVGQDVLGSGYELQLMEAALTAYFAQLLDADGYVVDPFKLTA